MLSLVVLALASLTHNPALIPETKQDFDPYLPLYHLVPTPFNWMNDPNGPFYDPVHKKYHLMYQYLTPRVWGHSVSDDLIHWKQLPIALTIDKPYDQYGVWSGSATILNDTAQTPVLMYSVATNDLMAIATPKNRSDPDLVEWVKSPLNPVIKASGDIPTGRDPTTAWISKAGYGYLVAYGTSKGGNNGGAVLFKSPDLQTFEKVGMLHEINLTGMWECPDFFELPGLRGTYVLKASTEGKDYWTTGTFDEENAIFIPTNSSEDVGTWYQRFDQGPFYASKSFFDPTKNRQVLFGWVLEERPVNANAPEYGWASVQSLPRLIVPDAPPTNPGGTQRLLTPPLPELAQLRGNRLSAIASHRLAGTDRLALRAVAGRQIEIVANLQLTLTTDALDSAVECGFSVLESSDLEEFSRFGVKFWRDSSGYSATLVGDLSQNSLNASVTHVRVDSTMYQPKGHSHGTTHTLTVAVNIFVDGSVVEIFANHGELVLTRRPYPTLPDSVGVSMYSVADGAQVCHFQGVEVHQIVV